MMTKKDAIATLLSELPDDPSVIKRVERAADILQSYGYSILQHTEFDGKETWQGYLVQKASTSLLEDNSVTYRVDKVSCTCPDFASARAGLCKHRLAIMLLETMEG